MSATNAHSDVSPPEGWQNFLRNTHAVGVGQGRWGQDDRPAGRVIRQLIKNSFFNERYGQNWDTHPFHAMVEHMLALDIDTLETASLMARGLVDEESFKLKIRVWEHEPPKTMEGLLEWMNGGINHENVHTIETLSGNAKAIRDWSAISSAFPSATWSVPTGFDRAKLRSLYEGNWPVDDRVPPSYTTKGTRTTPLPPDDESGGRPLPAMTSEEALDACKGIAEGLKKTGISLRDLKASLTGLPPAELGAWGGKCIKPPLGCGGEALDFRDRTSLNEYRITGLCQRCQDNMGALYDGPEFD